MGGAITLSAGVGQYTYCENGLVLLERRVGSNTPQILKGFEQDEIRSDIAAAVDGATWLVAEGSEQPAYFHLSIFYVVGGVTHTSRRCTRPTL